MGGHDRKRARPGLVGLRRVPGFEPEPQNGRHGQHQALLLSFMGLCAAHAGSPVAKASRLGEGLVESWLRMVFIISTCRMTTLLVDFLIFTTNRVEP